MRNTKQIGRTTIAPIVSLIRYRIVDVWAKPVIIMFEPANYILCLFLQNFPRNSHFIYFYLFCFLLYLVGYENIE